jgi:putative ABC transport system permease protein
LSRISGVTDVNSVRFLKVETRNLPVLAIIREFHKFDDIPINLRDGDPATIKQQLLDGAVVVGTITTARTGIGFGDELEVRYGGKTHRFPVAGTCSLYAMGGMGFFMDRDSAHVFGVEGADAFLVNAEEGARPQVAAQLRTLCAEQGLLFQTFADVENVFEGILNGVMASLWAILSLGFLIAVLGISNTLLMNVIEQTREIGLLRVVGMKAGGVRGMVVAQGVLIGLMSIVPGTLCGLLIALVLRLTVLSMLGTSFTFTIHPVLISSYLAGVGLILLAGAWLPAARASRLPLLQTIRNE